jgi:urea carboxylase
VEAARREGRAVAAGEPIAVIEAMKMECPVPSPASGIVRRVYVSEGQVVSPGAAMLAIEPA